jgi:hypothetical protein
LYLPLNLKRTPFSARPTVQFLTSLGATDFGSFKDAYGGYDWEAAANNDFSN